MRGTTGPTTHGPLLPSPLTGTSTILRGMFASTLAIGTAALAHSAAGHHMPHYVVLLLALTLSLPVCVALSRVRLSRGRLATGVLVSQSLLHLLFAFFPAQHGSGSSASSMAGSAHAHHGHAHLDHAQHSAESLVSSAVQPAHHAGILPDTEMALMHVAAAVFSYGVLRHSEVVIHALLSLLSVRPILLLLSTVTIPAARPRTMRCAARLSHACSPVWPGEGPRTLRGPPHT